MEANVRFTRLLSEESNCSTQSSDSCEYYHKEVYDHLPSMQVFRPEQSRRDVSEADKGLGYMSKRPKDKRSTQPLKNLPMCIQAKRDASYTCRSNVSPSMRQGGQCGSGCVSTCCG